MLSNPSQQKVSWLLKFQMFGFAPHIWIPIAAATQAFFGKWHSWVLFSLLTIRVLSLGCIHALLSPWLEVKLEKTLGKSRCEGIAHALPSKGLKLEITFPLYISPVW